MTFIKNIILTHLISVLICLSSQITKAEEISLTSTNWEPYNGELLPNFGFASEIISEAFRRGGCKVRFTFLPWKRAYEETREGKFDGLFAAYYSDERAEIFAPSDPYISGPLVFCSGKKTEIKYKSFRDLSPYRIGVVRGYVSTPEFDRADYLKKEEANSDLINLKKLIRGRVDLIVIDKYIALYYLKNIPSVEGDIGSVRFLTPPIGEKPLHIMFSKAVPDYEIKVRKFNRGLSEIKGDGTVDNILIKHGFSAEN